MQPIERTVDLLLERFRHIILLLDGDQTGRKATIVIAQQLRPHCHVRVVLLPDGVQPDQLPAEDIGNFLQPPPQRRLAVR
jgi:DNA primase